MSHLFYSFVITGWSAKVLSIGFLVFGMWLLIRKENISAFLACMFFSFLFAYAGGILVHIL
jgi:hypothetical protein